MDGSRLAIQSSKPFRCRHLLLLTDLPAAQFQPAWNAFLRIWNSLVAAGIDQHHPSDAINSSFPSMDLLHHGASAARFQWLSYVSSPDLRLRAYIYEYDEVVGLCVVEDSEQHTISAIWWDLKCYALLGDVLVLGDVFATSEETATEIPPCQPSTIGFRFSNPEVVRGDFWVWQAASTIETADRDAVGFCVREDYEAAFTSWFCEVNPDQNEPAPFLLYHIQLAKLRYNQRAFDVLWERNRRASHNLTLAHRTIFEALAASETVHVVSSDHMLAVQREAGIQTYLQSQLEELERTVRIVATELSAEASYARPAASFTASDGEQGYFAGAIAAAEDLQRQVEHELAYACAASGRAAGLARLAEAYAAAAMQYQQERQNELHLVSNSIIGGMGLGLAGLQVLGAVRDLLKPESLRQPLGWPMIMLLVAVGFTVPLFLARRARAWRDPVNLTAWAIALGAAFWLAWTSNSLSIVVSVSVVFLLYIFARRYLRTRVP